MKDFSANFIAENMYSQVDEDGNNIQILDSIVDCKTESNAVDKVDTCLRTKSGE